MTRTILVTGARGYLGGRLVSGLLEGGEWQVVGTTRSALHCDPSGWAAGVELRYLDPLAQDEAALRECLRGIDSIVHLAAADERASAEDPVAALLSGGVGTLKLLRAATAAGCRRFIFLSTMHVYGSPLEGRLSEESLPKPLHPYAIAHRTGEDYVLAARARGEIEGVVVRLSNGIGAPTWPSIDRWTLIGNDLCKQAVTGGKIALHSSGLQWRDFILLRDFVQAIELLLALPGPALDDGLFNLGGRMPMRMLDIAHAVSRRATLFLGRPVEVTAAKPAVGEDWKPIDYAIDRIVSKGFKPSPRSGLDEEIDATLKQCADWFA